MRRTVSHQRVLSTVMENVETQAVMIRLADDYDEMADRAEARLSNPEPPQI